MRNFAAAKGLFIVLLAGGVCLSMQDYVGNPALKLYVIECGHNQVTDQSVFSPGVNIGVGREMAINCYLIRHPLGTMIWGTGLNDGLIDKPEGIRVANDNFLITVTKTLASQLEEIGVAPADVKFVSMSHMHPDHSGNGNMFAGATLLIQQEEYDAAFGDDPGKYAFNPKFYGKLSAGPVIKLTGDHDVFQDGSVVIKRSIGHTPGHQSLFLRLPETGAVLLSGDLWHFAAQREHKRVPKFNFSKELTLQSMERMEAFVAESGATVWIEHDIDLDRTLKHAPEYYE